MIYNIWDWDIKSIDLRELLKGSVLFFLLDMIKMLLTVSQFRHDIISITSCRLSKL